MTTITRRSFFTMIKSVHYIILEAAVFNILLAPLPHQRCLYTSLEANPPVQQRTAFCQEQVLVCVWSPLVDASNAPSSA